MLNALPAFWVGLIYDDAAQKAARALTRGWSVAEIRALREAVPREGLTATIQGRSLRDVGRDVLAISRDGMNARGLEESLFLDPLDAILATGETQADRWLQRFDKIWHGDARMMLREAAI